MLLLATAASALFAVQWHGAKERLAGDHTRGQVQDAAARLRAGFAGDERALGAERALHAASGGEVSCPQSRGFVAALDLPHDDPGPRGMTFHLVVAGPDLAAFEAAVRADGRPDFAVSPPGVRAEHWVVRRGEPHAMSPRGTDTRTDDQVRPYLEHARDSGRQTLSGRAVPTNDQALSAGSRPVAPGLFAPLSRAGADTSTVSGRRTGPLGWATAPFRARDLVAGLAQVSGGLGVEVSGFHATSGAARSTAILVVGRPWLLRAAPLPGATPRPTWHGPAAAFAGGMALSALLAALVWTYGTGATQRARSQTRLLSRAEQLRASQAQLRRSEAVFRSAFDDALVGMTLSDVDGHYLRVNAVFAAMVGRGVEDLVGRHFREITLPEDAGSDRDAMARTLSGEAVALIRQKRYRQPDGSIVSVELSTSLVRDGDGAPLHFVTQYVDSTARRSAQRERDTRDLMLRAVIANSQSLVYVKDLDGRYLLANEPFQRAFSVTEDDLLGRDDTYLDPGLAPVWRVNDLRAQRGEHRVEEWSDGPDGRRYYESVKFPLLDPDGQVYATCGVSLDVTHNRQAAQAMERARDAALEATRAKSSFLATMSHEIRTPMNAVIGLTGLLLDTDLDAEQRELLQTVRSSGDALLMIINDILDFSKIEAGELTLDRHPFALRECVESALALVLLPAHGKGLELVADIDRACPELLVGDVTRFRQVIVNLLSNAVKFTRAGEVLVSVTATPAPGLLDTAGTEAVLVTVAVRDTGIGIPPDRIDRLFRSFSQVDASVTREYGGTGLGLAISRRLAQAMGGDLAVVSAVGVGSTFTLTALLGVGPDRREDPADPAEPLTGRTALVVDDNATNRRVLRLQLQGWGMTCTDLAGPAAALELVAGGAAFDVAVLDMHMPGMDGRQLAHALRRHPAGRDLPLVLLTSLHTRLDQPGHEVFAAVLTKPARSAVLREALVSVLTPTAALRAIGSAGGRRWRGGPPLASRPSLRVLLAEDNLVNQKVAQLMLGKLGHLVDTVSNGQEAVEAVLRARYDVVLMDVQMPVLDGLAATAAIREQVPAADQPYVVALTASALSEDRAACAAAGVDAFLSKPVRQVELDDALSAAVPHGGPPPATPAPMPPAPGPSLPGSPPDRDRGVRERLEQLGGGDPELLAELVQAFLDLVPDIVDELDGAVASGRAVRAGELAHSLGGCAGNVGAVALSSLCARLTAASRTHSPFTTGALLRQVRQELDAVTLTVSDLLHQLTEPARR